jgi:cytidylate kinase
VGFKVAIDGPSGVGKSTLAKGLAARFGFLHLDTGAMYRACGLYLIGLGAAFSDNAAAVEALRGMDIRVELGADGQRVFINERDFTPVLRTPDGDHASSAAGKVRAIREELVARQRAIAAGRDVVLDGRDIGTVVLPDAEVKLFLTAGAGIRAARRAAENAAKGIASDPAETLSEIERRDYADTHRAHSPLAKAADAVEIDTSAMSADEVLAAAAAIIEEKRGG